MSDLPQLNFSAISAAPILQPRPKVRPIDFEGERRRSEHRLRLLRHAEEMHDAAVIAARQRHEQDQANAFERGRTLGREVGYQAGYVDGTHRGRWLHVLAGMALGFALVWAALQLGRHWPELERWLARQAPAAAASATTPANARGLV